MTSICNFCNKPFDPDRVARSLGEYSSALAAGCCSAQCYTEMTAHVYGVRNRQTGLLFAGFDDSNRPIWTDDEVRAWKHNYLAAKAQAALLVGVEPVACH